MSMINQAAGIARGLVSGCQKPLHRESLAELRRPQTAV